MPNWVKSKLEIGGENYEAVIAEITTKDEDGNINFDFNKIIPIPESLRIIYGSVTNKAIALYLTSVNPNAEYYGSADNKIPLAEYSEILSKLKASGMRLNLFDIMAPVEEIAKYEKEVVGDDPEWRAGETLDEAIAYGKRAVDNVLQYGYMNWYDWAVDKWGTKWNSFDTVIDGNIIEFLTAWTDVSDLMRKLSEKYPDNTFYYDFAEEQAGLYAGQFAFENGEEIGGGHFEEYSKEAYEKYFEIWGSAEDYKYNKRTKTYERAVSGSEM
jgi:hypothetical protein